MRQPFSPIILLLFLAAVVWLMLSINLGLIELSFEKLGLDPGSAYLLLFVSLFGSALNLPLFTLEAYPDAAPIDRRQYGLLQLPAVPFDGHIRVVANVGGCVVPVMFSAFLLRHTGVPIATVAIATAVISALSYFLSRPIPGVGIGMPMLAAPVSAALVAMLLGGEHQAAVAYISGTLGVLIGADLLRLNDIRGMQAPIAAIGGAGTFDGIYITGLVAVLLT